MPTSTNNDRVLELLRSPDFAASLIAGLQAKITQRKEKREAFIRSDTFKRMCDILTSSKEPLELDSEETAYFLDEVTLRLGWEFATEDDVNAFFDAVADPAADTIVVDATTEDPAASFESLSFQHFGLQVFMLFGQGTFVQISNTAHRTTSAANSDDSRIAP